MSRAEFMDYEGSGLGLVSVDMLRMQIKQNVKRNLAERQEERDSLLCEHSVYLLLGAVVMAVIILSVAVMASCVYRWGRGRQGLCRRRHPWHQDTYAGGRTM